MRRPTKVLGTLAIATVLAMSTARAAGADPPQFDVDAGLPVISDFGDVTLTGAPQLTTATIAPFIVLDTSGTLEGWHVTLLVPTFRNGTGADCAVGATAEVSTESLAMAAPIVAPGDGDTSMTGITASGYTDFTVPRTIVSAAAGAGDGTYVVTPQILKLAIPTTTRADAYCTQATISIASGP